MPKKPIKKYKKKKESMFSNVFGYESKEAEDDFLIKGGYLATTHLDSGWYDEDRKSWVRDQISEDTIRAWADDLKLSNPRVNKASINHNRIPHVAGVAVADSIRVDEFDNGEFGLYADVLIDSTREDFDKTKFRLDNGLLDSFSIEYDTGLLSQGEYYEGAVIEKESDNGIVRTLLPNTKLEGFTLASQPMNENCVMIKEIQKKEIKKEAVKMAEEEKKPDEEKKDEK